MRQKKNILEQKHNKMNKSLDEILEIAMLQNHTDCGPGDMFILAASLLCAIAP